MSTTFNPCIVDNNVRLAAYQNCAISMWNGASGNFRASVAKQDELINYISSKYREGPVFFVVVTQGTPMPNSAQRKELEAFFTRWPWRAVAQVAEGTDLWSMTTRTIMTGLRLLQRASYPNQLFSEVVEAGQWAAEYIVKAPGLSAGDTVRAVEDAVEGLRKMT